MIYADPTVCFKKIRAAKHMKSFAAHLFPQAMRKTAMLAWMFDECRESRLLASCEGAPLMQQFADYALCASTHAQSVNCCMAELLP